MTEDNSRNSGQMARRDFVKYSTLTALALSMGFGGLGCGGERVAAAAPTSVDSVAGANTETVTAGFPIDADVQTTVRRTITFPSVSGLSPAELRQVSKFAELGYGAWQYGPGLGCEQRNDLMPSGYSYPSAAGKTSLLNFFTMSDVHITDKETPNQMIYLQQTEDQVAQVCTSIYSPVMLYTTHVLDAAVQTVNALHKKNAFDCGIFLGDASNSTAYNELRWYIDVLDGKVITPSSGAHLGADSIDYQKPYKAAGLDRNIAWYQVIGNHDKFYTGSFDVYHYPDPAFKPVTSYTSGSVWAIGDVFSPKGGSLNIMRPTYYAGVLDGATPLGDIINAGPVASFGSPPTVAADPNRRPLRNNEWVAEFFNTASHPVGHGFNLVENGQEEGFACYSFLPKSNLPLKIIALDNNQGIADGSFDIHGHGFLDQARWNWLKKELADGDASGQLMIIAAHIPIGVAPLGSELEWWRPDLDPYIGAPVPGGGVPTATNAVTLQGLIAELQSHPNLLMWIAGHRHLNTIKAYPGPTPEQGFWHVETCSLRDFPQQFRTFELRLNSDDTLSIVTVEVDPAVAEGTPAAKSREYAVATQQIVKSNLSTQNNLIDVQTQQVVKSSDGTPVADPSIRPMPTASYNAELFKKLSPAMVKKLRSLFPASRK